MQPIGKQKQGTYPVRRAKEVAVGRCVGVINRLSAESRTLPKGATSGSKPVPDKLCAWNRPRSIGLFHTD